MVTYKLGWLRDLPDFRDFDPANSAKTKAVGVRSEPRKAVTRAAAAEYLEQKTVAAPARSEIDLSIGFPPIEDQGDLGSCTAHAGTGLLEYYELQAFGSYVEASRLFLYKVTRNLLGWTGDTGAYLRTTMKAMALFGVTTETRIPYVLSRYEEEPSAFDYAYASNYQSISYFRLDQTGSTPQAVLAKIRAYTSAGFPSMFGFTLYNYGNQLGEIAFPSANDAAIGGHAVVVAGYDDNRQIGNHKGALKIRNSWGLDWGQQGYGWLPYEYVLTGLAVDFWSLFRAEYIGNGLFA